MQQDKQVITGSQIDAFFKSKVVATEKVTDGNPFSIQTCEPPSDFLSRGILAYDDGPHTTVNGKISRCTFCPTAIVKGDKLVRCCEMSLQEGAPA